MYLWTCVLAFGGLAFAVFPWQIVLAVDVAATTIMAVVTAWPYLRDKAPGLGRDPRPRKNDAEGNRP